MAKTVLREKSHAGNPHVRFAERLRCSKSLICAMIGAFCIPALFADVFTILPDKAGKWNEATSYSEGTGTPGVGDVVQVLGNTSVSANAADIDFLEKNGVGSISFDMRKGQARPSLTIDVAETEDVSFSGLITNRTKQIENTYFGSVVKNGAGILRLAQTTGIYGLRVELTVNDGILQLPRTAKTSGSFNANYMRATVNAPGTLILTSSSGIVTASWFYGGLCGDGIVSNAYSTAATCYVDSAEGYDDDPVFSGRIWGNVRMYIRTNSSFTGTNGASTATFHDIVTSCNLRMAAVGGTYGGLSNPGSFGSTAYYNLDAHPTLTYLGFGETSYADFRATKDFGPSFTLNGGPNGGFEHRGAVTFSNASTNTATFILSGDHTNDCTFAAVLVNKVTDAARVTQLVKRGSGRWNVRENAESNWDGVVTVEDGTLSFDTIAETNALCALGRSTLRSEGEPAILLGTASTTGTLAYAGTTAALGHDRPIALAGDGKLTSDLADLAWYGISSVDTGFHALTLGGPMEMSIRDVTDGAGQVKVIKEGAGTLTLGGELDFTGGLDVRQGEVVLNQAATNDFRYYRIFFKENNNSDGTFDIGSLGFFDATGKNWTTNETVAQIKMNWDASGRPWLLGPGEAAPFSYDPNFNYKTVEEQSNYNLSRLFRYANNNFARYSAQNGKTPTPDDKTSWLGVVVRLPAEAPAIAYYDFGVRWVTSSNGATPKTWSVEGSVDGVTWTEISSLADQTQMGGANTWFTWASHYVYQYPNRNLTSNPPRAIATGSEEPVHLVRGLDDVSVATGARLTTNDGVTTRKVTIDASGMGVIAGLTLAEGGVIDIANAPAKGSFDVAVDLTGVTLPVTFSFTVNGSVDRRQVTLSADRRKIQVSANGLILILR